jgi:hypothetical protein
MTTTNRLRLTSEAPELGAFKRVEVVPGGTAGSTVASTESAGEFRWVEVRTAKALGSVSVTVSPTDEARKRANRRFNRGTAGR